MNTIKGTSEFKTTSFPIAIVVSSFNSDITAELRKGAVERLLERGFSEHDILVVEVPGAVEIPVTASLLAKNQCAKAIIVLGSVIRGETDHYDCVFEQINYGCQRVALDYQLPVIFEVLMTENEAQAHDRIGGSHGHKGVSAADCAIDTYDVLEKINSYRGRV